MGRVTCIIDPKSGVLTLEGLDGRQTRSALGDLLPPAAHTNCARPAEQVLASELIPAATSELRVARIYHGSGVDGPGRRSVVQLQGCPLRCPGCYVPGTHDPSGGVGMTVKGVVAALLDPRGEPRDGVTVLGGEPFYQPTGLAKLLRILQARDVHTTVYTGYTAEALARLPDPKVCNALRAIDLLIDGPFVREASSNAGEWRGSRNQRFIRHPGRLIAHREVIGWIDEV